MHRTTILLSPALKAQASRKAKQLGISFGELVRESLASFLRKPEESSSGQGDPLFSDRAVFEGRTPEDLAGDHDRHLYGDSR